MPPLTIHQHQRKDETNHWQPVTYCHEKKPILLDSRKIIPSVQNSPSSSTISLINIDLKLKSKETIRGHPNYSSCYRRMSWRCISACPQIRYPLWSINVEIIICNIIYYSPPLRPYLPTIYQNFLQDQNCMFNELAEKTYTSRIGQRSSIIDMYSIIYCDKIMNCVHYGTAMKLAIHLRTGQLLQFWVSIRFLETNWSPHNKEKKLVDDITLSENTSTAWTMYPDLVKLYDWEPLFWTPSLPLFQVCCHRSLVLFRRGFQTECRVPNWVD